MSKFSDLLKNMGNGSRITTALIAIGGIIFHTGKISQNVDDIIPRIYALEKKDRFRSRRHELTSERPEKGTEV